MSKSLISKTIEVDSTTSFTISDGTNNILTVDSTNEQLLMRDGSVSLPAYAFVGDTNSGIYRIGADKRVCTVAKGPINPLWVKFL